MQYNFRRVLGIPSRCRNLRLVDKRIVGALGVWERHGSVVSVSGHFMEPPLESDVGNDERCSRQEVALRRNEVQQVRGTLINRIAGTCGMYLGNLRVGLRLPICSSSWRLEEFSLAGTSAVTLMAMRTELFQKGQEMHKDALVFKRTPLHGGKSPKLKRSPVRGVKKVSVKGERVQD